MDDWQTMNAQVIEKLGLTMRQRDVADTGVPVKMIPGDAYEISGLPSIDIAAGVTASLCWARGAMLEHVDMQAHAEYPQEQLSSELFMMVQEGSATCALDGTTAEVVAGAVVYVPEGTTRSLKAGPNGLKGLEIFSPVRADHLHSAGVDFDPKSAESLSDEGVTYTSLESCRVYDLSDVPRTAVGPPTSDPNKIATDQVLAHARIMWGRHVMLSSVKMAPHAEFPWHIHPEDQLMLTLDGEMIEEMAHAAPTMRGDKQHHILHPGGMAHTGKLSPQGAENLDVFWPIRPDYMALHEQQNGKGE